MVQTFDTAAFKAAMEKKQTLAPVMEQVSEELSDRATFVKIDVDDNPDLAREYSIMSIPCVMVFKNGELAGKNVGFGAKAAMKEFIEKYI